MCFAAQVSLSIGKPGSGLLQFCDSRGRLHPELRLKMAENSKQKRIVLTLIAALVVLVLAMIALRRQPPVVSAVTVTRENVSETISSNGKVEPISPDVAHAEFPAFVDRVRAAEGQSVQRGQEILALDVADIQYQLTQARANLLAAQTDLQNARSGGPPDELAQVRGGLQQARVDVANLERTETALEELVTKQAATQDELAQNQAALAKARSRAQELEQRKEALAQRATVTAESASLMAKQAQDQVQSLEEKVRSAKVIASREGTLYSLPVHAGDYVKVGDVLAEMADLRHVQVRAFVDEPDLGRLATNQDVEVTWDAKPGRTWSGRTEQIPKQVVPHGMRSVGEVLCSVDNSKLELLPNVNVEVTILVVERRDALVVPRAAVREGGGKHYVFVFQDDKLHRRDISVGIASASNYEVLSGLALNDRVALPGDRNLRDGMEVHLAEGN
jgi:HlyD family secretion protein